ncbi:hypothetical protein [Actinoplanes sp. GCM10030250]|uniref:hypothetical protein n=1 Tax=Actinoplanes sp. GCM10030250 TaxID=3273376 RepID=UPI003606BF7D
MTFRTALRIGRTAVYLAVAAGLLWCLWFAALWMFGDEGAMPPRWRIPAVPAGATVVEDTMMCASGGCWWSLTLTPSASQTPEDLAREMGLARERTLPPTLTDPGFVTVGADPRQDRLVVYVGYR